MVDVTPGLLLISDPFLKDPNFLRTVVLICEHQFEGSFGFVLNRQYEQTIGELIGDLENYSFPVYYGGPVQVDTIHFLHVRPDLISGGTDITDGIYWGGDFEEVVTLIKNDMITPKDIRFFIGYSGWGEGQLENELQTKSWITRKGNQKLIFHDNISNIWKDALHDLGGEYKLMVNYPIDPQLN
ncbi:YqgE/AlgH family protein [Chitinophagaceae bacterium LWZ2-11]